MNSTERAEKIWATFVNPNLIHDPVAWIAAEIEQAEAASYVQGQLDGTKREEEKWVRRGMESAYEDAAKIAWDTKFDSKDIPFAQDVGQFLRTLICEAIRAKAREL